VGVDEINADVVSLTKRLIRIPSPFGKEKKIAKFVADYLDKVELQEVEGCGPNIIAKKVRDDELPSIILNAHMDTVEVWKGGLNPRIRGKHLLGLGAADMKAGLALILDTFKNFEPKKLNLILAVTVDEEGNSLGAYRLLKQKKLKADMCLIPEPTKERLELGARGRYVVEIEFKGEGGHGARPQKTENAIEDAGEVLRALRKLKLRTHPKLGKGSHCALTIRGGGDSLSIPSCCILRVDRHIVPGESKSIVMKDFKNLIDQIPLRTNVKLRWMKRPTSFLEPYITKRTSLVNSFIEEHRKFFAPEIEYCKSVGDYNLFAKRVPTVVFGPKGGYWHTEKEYVDVESLRRCRRFYHHFLRMVDKKK